MPDLDGAALSHTVHSLRAAPTRSVQAERAAAGLQPALDGVALGRVGVRARPYVFSNRLTGSYHSMPSEQEVVGNRGRDVLLCQELQ